MEVETPLNSLIPQVGTESWCDHSSHDEIDRCARAYGWEIGNGAKMGRVIELSDNNPFKHADWRQRMEEELIFNGE
jgi:hypothetical protein